MIVTLNDKMSVQAGVACECGRYITFRPGSDLTVPDLFRAAEHALYACTCQVEESRVNRAAAEAIMERRRKRLSAP